MHQYVADFDLLTEAFATHRSVDLNQIVGLEGVLAGDRSIDDKANGSQGQALMQSLFLRFIAEGWHITCLPPGVEYSSFPGSTFITRAMGEGGNDVLGHWLILVMDSNGRRPGTRRVELAAKALTHCLRTCAVVKCQLTHTLGINAMSTQEVFDKLRDAENELSAGNVAHLRQFLGTTPAKTESEQFALSFFGAVWDLMSMLGQVPAEIVAPGTWRFPDPPQRALRAKAAIVKDAATAFLAPATFRSEVLRMHALEWTTIAGTAMLQEMSSVLDTISLAHSVWLTATYHDLESELLRGNALPSAVAARKLQGALAGDPNSRLPKGMMLRASEFLTRHGHADWSFRIKALVHANSQDDRPEAILARRLRGLRIVAGLSLRDAAATVGVTSSKASHLLSRQFRLGQVDEEWLSRDVARVEEALSGRGSSGLKGMLEARTVDESVFDTFESLQPDSTPNSTAHRGRNG